MYLIIKHLKEQGVSNHQIAKRLGVDKKTVLRNLKKIQKGEPAPQRAPVGSKLDPFREQIIEGIEAGRSAIQIYQDLLKEPGFSACYDLVKKWVAKRRPTSPEVYCRLRVRPAEEAQVDFGWAGRFLVEGKAHSAWAFVMTLSWSRYAHYELVLDQKVPTFLSCLIHALELFGGVPQRIKLDNLKAAILWNSLQERYYQQEFARLSAYYGFVPDPCRVATPTDKGKVESGVGYVKKNALAGRSFPDFQAARDYLLHWRDEVANLRIHGTTKRRPIDLFQQEREALRPLPAVAFPVATWGEYRVRKDCHIHVLGNYYSVPYLWVGKKVTVRIGQESLRIFGDYELLWEHPLALGKGKEITHPGHYPSQKRIATQAIHQQRLERVRSVGPMARAYLARLKEDPRKVFSDQLKGLSRLCDQYSREILERAFERALLYEAFDLKVLQNILQQGLWQLPLEPWEPPGTSVQETPETLQRPLSAYEQLLS